VSSPFNRSLFAQMPPSIVITEPVPRWKALALLTLRFGALLLLGTVSFYAGMRYERQTPPMAKIQRAAPPTEPAASNAGGAALQARPAPSVGAAPQAPAQPRVEVTAPVALEGLQVQSLKLTADPAVAGQFRYEFEVLNDGRLYEGSFDFLVLGQQDGRVQQWSFPAEAQRGSGAYRLRVARYLKMEGRIQMPAGLQPQTIVLHLRETTGLRASRAQPLAPADVPAAGAAARP
jgi:hypothetical protein